MYLHKQRLQRLRWHETKPPIVQFTQQQWAPDTGHNRTSTQRQPVDAVRPQESVDPCRIRRLRRRLRIGSRHPHPPCCRARRGGASIDAAPWICTDRPGTLRSCSRAQRRDRGQAEGRGFDGRVCWRGRLHRQTPDPPRCLRKLRMVGGDARHAELRQSRGWPQPPSTANRLQSWLRQQRPASTPFLGAATTRQGATEATEQQQPMHHNDATHGAHES